MGMPAVRVLDPVLGPHTCTGPGVPNVMIGGQPAAVLGDLVAGPTFTGVITVCTSTVMIGGRQAATVGAQMALTNIQSSATSTVPIAPPGFPTVTFG